jgi:hypothetical protein
VSWRPRSRSSPARRRREADRVFGCGMDQARTGGSQFCSQGCRTSEELWTPSMVHGWSLAIKQKRCFLGLYRADIGSVWFEVLQFTTAEGDEGTCPLRTCKRPAPEEGRKIGVTQRGPGRLMVRGILVMVAKKTFRWDVVAKPPAHVPSLNRCLAHIAERGNERRQIYTARTSTIPPHAPGWASRQ